jgi:hypothetical protein
MSPLHISKVAIGCKSFDALRKRQGLRLRDGIVPVITRFRPKRAEELIGGSIFWIIKHHLAARQTIIGFSENAQRKTVIRLDPELVPVRALPRRAHQGWRYLTAEDAPVDFDGEDDGISAMPPGLAVKLAALALI